MRNRILSKSIATAIAFLFSITFIQAQSTGYINRPTTTVVISTGDAVLDPNNDNYTSTTTAGFNGNDVTNSEIPFRSVPSFSTEPFGDLRRGPSHLYSDFVPDANNVGYYTYFDGTNLLFRFRVGSIMPGSKGYSVLLDTDGKFGATGANADPNYQPATTGTNGNPGFEIEIVLETNSRIAIYNVDGSSSATLIKSYVSPTGFWTDMSQISIAGTFDNGDPDFFIDFYIPFSDLTSAPFSLTTSTPLRMSATTVMSSQAAIGGPKSDIYGLSDAGYKGTNEQYEAYINAQPSFTASGLQSGGFGSICTAAPMLNTPISTGATSVSGTWTKSTLSGAASSATIKIYKDGVYTGNSVTTSGGSWTVSGLTALSANQVITAKAVAIGESECLSSNSVTVSSCNSNTKPATPALSCATFSKGLSGTNRGSTNSIPWVIHVDNVSTNDNRNSTSDVSTAYFSNMSGATWDFSKGCTTGNQMQAGSYKIYYTDNTGCNSEPLFACVNPGTAGSNVAGTLGIPTITNPSGSVFTTATDTISGTTQSTTNGTFLTLYVDNYPVATTTSSTTSPYSFSFPNLKLLQGQNIYITNEYNTGTQSTSYCQSKTASFNILCYTSEPLINVDNNNEITVGQPITGISSEPAGTTIKVYTSPANTLVSTIAVQSGGTWTTGAYTAVSSTSYYATAQNGTCGVSATSGIAAAASPTTGRCGTITGPIVSSDGSVSGTITGSVSNTTVNLYLDDILIGSTTTNNTAWNISVSNLYNSGVLKIGVREGTNQEQICTSSATTITCSSGPITPVFTPTNSGITQGQTQTYTISNAVIGAFYGISNASTGQSIGNGVWATSSTVNLTTTNLTTNSYTVAIKGTALSGVSICSSSPANANLLVSSVLPLNMLEFTARKTNSGVQLQWITEAETGTSRFEIERSSDGTNFNKIGEKASKNISSGNTYTFLDEAPLLVNHYRLKIMDEDGKYSYSKIVVVNQTAAFVSKIHPNPFIQSFVINTSLPSAQPLKVQLLDMNGSLIRYKSVNGLAGENRIEFNDLGNLQAGMYMVRLIRLDSVVEQKIIKAKQ
jgi:hypothetical protein